MNIPNPNKFWIIVIVLVIIVIWFIMRPKSSVEYFTVPAQNNQNENDIKNTCQPTKQNLQSLTIGSKFYTNISNIYPGQLRYSEDNVELKIKDFISKGYAANCLNNRVAKSSGTNNRCKTFAFDGGKSVFNIKEVTFPVVIGPYAAILVDGHHDTIAAKRLGSQTMPINVIDDLSHLSFTDFYTKAQELNYIYPYDLDGNFKTLPCSFNELVNDTNRYFAAIVYKKCSSEDDTNPTGPNINLNCMDQPCLTGSKSNESHQINPLWIKMGQSIPFIEFRISTLLRKKGLVFDTSKISNQEYICCFIQQARQILDDALSGDCLDQLLEPQSLNKHIAQNIHDMEFEPLSIRKQQQKKCMACFIRSPRK